MSKTISVREKTDELHALTAKIKETVIKTNLVSLAVAQKLSHIKKEKLYRYWDSSRSISWAEWVANSEIPLSVDIADSWVRIYEAFIEKWGIKDETLSDISQRKLLLVARNVPETKEEAEKLLDKARAISELDLREELSGEECIHPDVQAATIKVYKCSVCNRTWAQDPRQEGERRIAEGQQKDFFVKLLKEKFGLEKLDGSYKENRDYAGRCIRKFGEQELSRILEAGSMSEFWKDKITSFKTVYYNGVKIVKGHTEQEPEEANIPDYAKDK